MRRAPVGIEWLHSLIANQIQILLIKTRTKLREAHLFQIPPLLLLDEYKLRQTAHAPFSPPFFGSISSILADGSSSEPQIITVIAVSKRSSYPALLSRGPLQLAHSSLTQQKFYNTVAGSVWEFGVLLCKPTFIALVTCEPSPGGADKMKAAVRIWQNAEHLYPRGLSSFFQLGKN